MGYHCEASSLCTIPFNTRFSGSFNDSSHQAKEGHGRKLGMRVR